MEEAIRKLMAEYEQKIINCDVLLNNLQEKAREARKKDFSSDTLAIIRSERGEVSSRRQAYVQAKVDIESLLDEQ